MFQAGVHQAQRSLLVHYTGCNCLAALLQCKSGVAYQAEQPRLRPAAAQRAAEPVVADVDDAQAGELPGRRVRQRATARRVGEESARAVSSARYLPMRSSEPICHQQQPLPCKAMVNLHASYSAHLKSLLSSSRKVRLG